MQDLQTKFIDYLRFEKRYSPHTILAYEKDLGQFAFFIAETYETLIIEKVKRTHIRSWMANLSAQKDKSKRYCRARPGNPNYN